jgi:hypothetical protein
LAELARGIRKSAIGACHARLVPLREELIFSASKLAVAAGVQLKPARAASALAHQSSLVFHASITVRLAAGHAFLPSEIKILPWRTTLATLSLVVIDRSLIARKLALSSVIIIDEVRVTVNAARGDVIELLITVNAAVGAVTACFQIIRVGLIERTRPTSHGLVVEFLAGEALREAELSDRVKCFEVCAAVTLSFPS